MCLLSDRESILILEQPELHLHPAMQQRLGDFLLAMARAGRQLIVETHSEYMITRLRRRIAEDTGTETSDLVRVVSATKREGRTEFAPVNITELGTIEEWPQGFFDQAALESQELVLAGLRKLDVATPTRS
jgi:predicted ATPase